MSAITPLHGPRNHGDLSYYAYVAPKNLVTWAMTAMKNSYAPYSHIRQGVLLRTENGDIATGCTVETVNWDGLTAIEIALGKLFVTQPWVDHKNRPEKISDIIFAYDDFNPENPDSFVPSGRSLDWLRKFGSPDTVLHFAKPDGGIMASMRLNQILPHGPRMKALSEYLDRTSLFRNIIQDQQEKPDDVTNDTWHSLRRSRLHAFAPFSNYRVGVVVEAVEMEIPETLLSEMQQGFKSSNVDQATINALMERIYLSRKRFAGINVEISGNEALHAEGAAIGGMISELGPKAKLTQVWVQGGFNEGAEDCHYCGKCRQLINEFSTATTHVHVLAEKEIVSRMKVQELLPGGFVRLG